jgi:hypothetical protein
VRWCSGRDVGRRSGRGEERPERQPRQSALDTRSRSTCRRDTRRLADVVSKATSSSGLRHLAKPALARGRAARARSSPGAPHRGGGLPASEPGLRAGTHDLVAHGSSRGRTVPRRRPPFGRVPTPDARRRSLTTAGGRADVRVCRRPGVLPKRAAGVTVRHPDTSGRVSGWSVTVRTKVLSASAKPRLAGRQPSAAVGCPGCDQARIVPVRASADLADDAGSRGRIVPEASHDTDTAGASSRSGVPSSRRPDAYGQRRLSLPRLTTARLAEPANLLARRVLARAAPARRGTTPPPLSHDLPWRRPP